MKGILIALPLTISSPFLNAWGSVADPPILASTSGNCGYYSIKNFVVWGSVNGGSWEVWDHWSEYVWVPINCNIPYDVPEIPIDPETGGGGAGNEIPYSINIEENASKRSERYGIYITPVSETTNPSGGYLSWSKNHTANKIWTMNVSSNIKSQIANRLQISGSDSDTVNNGFANTKSAPWWLCGREVWRDLYFNVTESGKPAFEVYLSHIYKIQEAWGFGSYAHQIQIGQF